MNIIQTASGIEYVEREFVDSWGRRRVCHKRLDELPKPHAETCVVCGASIDSERSTKRYCGDACRMKAYRARQAPRVKHRL